MHKGFRALVLLLMLPAALLALSLPERYPDYTYVFSEFDVDEAYIDNADFKRFVQQHEKEIKHLYARSMQRGALLSPMVKGYLMEQGLSDLFIYLSMVESGLSTDAVSAKKAVGLWQFMPATALHYKLDVCNSFDERCDPISATAAAIRYLSRLHRQFGKWYLAAIAYNCGEGRLKKAIANAGSDELGILTDERDRYLPKETRDYIRKILLAAMIGEASYLDFSADAASGGKRLVEVEVSGGCDLDALAKLLEMPPRKLRKMNRQFTRGIVPKEKPLYTLMIPEEKMLLFYMKYEPKEEKKRFKPHLISHTVRMGETLEGVAREYNTTAEEIAAANKLDDGFLTLDTILLVPVTQEMFETLLRGK